MLFKNQSNMAAVKIANNIFATFKSISWAHVLFCTKTSVSGSIWFRGVYQVKIRWSMFDLSSN